MDVEGFCRQSNVVVVVGKGGVGKTTVTAALAVTAANAGLDVLVCALEEGPGLPTLFDHAGDFGYAEVALRPGHGAAAGGRRRGRVGGQVITSDAALIEYLSSHGLGRVSRRLISSGALEVVSTAIPGIRDVLVLGKLKQLEQSAVYDLIVLDAPASGHAVSFFTSSGGLLDSARSGPLRSQAEQVVELLSDPHRCQVVLVTVAEETPVNEVVETAYRLEDEVGVALGPVIVNCCFPILDLDTEPTEAARRAGVGRLSSEFAEDLARAARFRRARQNLQSLQLDRLAHELPLARIELPYLFRPELGPTEIDELADVLATGIKAIR